MVIKLRDDTADALAIKEGKPGMLWIFLDKVSVCVDRVWLRKFFLNHTYDGHEILLALEGSKRDLLQKISH
jgi:hypothetical protein